MDDDQFFGAPPAEEAPPAGEDGGFTLLGDDGDAAPADYVGDVQEGGVDDMGFAGAPAEDAFAAPPIEDDFGMSPAEDTPIVLAPPPEEEAPIAMGGEDEAPAVEAVVPIAGPMQKWNDEWQATLAARKEEENVKKAELVESSRIAMEEFQKERELKRETKMAKNREDEQAKLEAIEADLENDNSWQRVCKMVDLTHDGAEAGEDTKRMRDVFIMLKNEQGLAAKVGA